MHHPPAANYVRKRPKDVSEELARRAFAQQDLLARRGLQPVLTLGHLAHLTGVSYKYLHDLVNRRTDGYTVFPISKPSGHERWVAVPEDELLHVQSYLLKNVFAPLDTSPSSYAYRQGSSIVKCAQRHQGARWALKFDLRDFFHQTDETQVFEILQRVGYSSLVSLELSRLVTRAAPQMMSLPRKYRRRISPKSRVAFPYRSYPYLGYLPQGAPTSGAISNILAIDLDEQLDSYAQLNDMVYTRYADDLTFSSGGEFSRSASADHVRAIYKCIRDAGYLPNKAKTQVIDPGRVLTVVGLTVTDNGLRVRRSLRNRLENHLRCLVRYGVVNHANHLGFRDPIGLLNHINGLIDYVNMVEPDRARRYRQIFLQFSQLQSG